MIYPPIEKLLERTNNDKYMLCITTSLRARQLQESAGGDEKPDFRKVISEAISDINEGKITYRRKRMGYRDFVNREDNVKK